MKLKPITAAAAFLLAGLTAGETRAAFVTTLFAFDGANGATPEAGLIRNGAGNLFGTTAYGGAHNQGTVYEIPMTASGYASAPTILYSFCALEDCADGALPAGRLTFGPGGNLFGTTLGGGAHNRGTVFEIAKTATGYASVPTVLYSFCAQDNCADGESPSGGLIADEAGNLFGATSGGRDAAADGTVFEIHNTASGYASEQVLVRFNGSDGSAPNGDLIFDAAGNLFGTTILGGSNVQGTVFEIRGTASGYANTPTVLADFHEIDGAHPQAGLIADFDGNLFGTTSVGGAHDQGTVFEIAKTASGYAVSAKSSTGF